MLSEKSLKNMISLGAFLMFTFFICFVLTLFLQSIPSIKATGFSFYYTKEWNPLQHKFGVLPFVTGTLITSFLALIIATPFALSSAIFLGEYLKKGFVHSLMKGAIDLLAGIPSIIYGFWGLFYIVPILRKIEIKLHLIPYGVGILSASLILAIMIIPFCASFARESICLIPKQYKEVAISLGATRFEMIRKVLLPYSYSGIMTGFILALGRALGETMAVTLVIGNSNQFPSNLFSPSNTIASVIANEFSEASDPIYLSVLIHLALVLFLITTVINLIGQKCINRFQKRENRTK